MKTKNKTIQYYKQNAEEDYLTTPISVLRYISELENMVNVVDTVKCKHTFTVDDTNNSDFDHCPDVDYVKCVYWLRQERGCLGCDNMIKVID
jgi:hypothetical protein